jgi:hypothetical protein
VSKIGIILSLGTALSLAAGAAGAASGARGIGVDPATLSPVVDNPYVAFAALRHAVYAGKELDPETKEDLEVRVEVTVRDTPETVVGVKATVVEVSDFEDGELVEKTRDYYAQDRAGVVYYLGERVDDYEDGKVTGHGGQWVAGENGSLAGVFMPAAPGVGDVFEQERAPGIAADRSKVVAVGRTVTVPAGTFTDCVEVEDYDPIGKSTQRKFYCRGVGLVREDFGGGRTLDLIERRTR